MAKHAGARTGAGGAKEVFRTLFKKWDLLIIAVVLVAAALSVWFALREDGGEVRVYADGTLRYTFSLSEDGEYDILDGKKKPADMPIQSQKAEKVLVNLKTAETMGIQIPEDILKTAETVK